MRFIYTLNELFDGNLRMEDYDITPFDKLTLNPKNPFPTYIVVATNKKTNDEIKISFTNKDEIKDYYRVDFFFNGALEKMETISLRYYIDIINLVVHIIVKFEKEKNPSRIELKSNSFQKFKAYKKIP